MKEKSIGTPFTHEQELTAGTSKGILLGKLENIVLLDVVLTSAKMPGGTCKQIFTFAPVESTSAAKGIIRFDVFDASTGVFTEGDEIIIDIVPVNVFASANASSEKSYANITGQKIQKIIDKLREYGASVSGNNPWTVNLNQHGVKLFGSWDESRSVLTIKVVDKNFYVSYSQIWDRIDPLINHL